MNLWADEMRERSNERWGRTDFGAEPDRSRAGTRPISSRNRTDLGEAGGARAVHRRVTIRVGATTGGRAANLGT